MRQIFVDHALANRHANRAWLEIMRNIEFDVLDADRGAFFGSIFATWNHILLGDRIWLGRITGEPIEIGGLDDRLCNDLESLAGERSNTDEALLSLVESERDFTRVVEYSNNAGLQGAQQLFQILNHLFAHQHHHRGQISQMCHALGIVVPDGGLIDYYRDVGG